MKSLWKDEFCAPNFPELCEDIKTDVIVIGGGLSGLLTAYFLKNKGVDCVLLEQDRICSGTTGNTTAKITVQHGLVYSKIKKQYGDYVAQKYLRAHMQALKKYNEMCKNVDCGFLVKDNYVYSDSLKKLEEELKTLESIGCYAEYKEDLPLPIKTKGAVVLRNQAQFNPLKFACGISKELKIYEHTKVAELKGTTAKTSKGNTVRGKKIVVCTHFPFINKHGSYFLKLYQHRSYVIALKGAGELDGMYVSDKKTGLSFSSFNGYLLLGGGAHRTGKKGGNWQELREFAKKYYPNAQECFSWAAQDTMSLDAIPYIGNYSKNTPDLYVASGFNKWGITSSMTSAMILSDLITGKENINAEVFSPSRNILKPQLAINGFETTVNFVTPTAKRCPHMGCALKYNKAEHSWDCACHGSRFDEEGRVLNNPATQDLPN